MVSVFGRINAVVAVEQTLDRVKVESVFDYESNNE
jgi:hypothetical protein